jgi:hypothetical protein
MVIFLFFVYNYTRKTREEQWVVMNTLSAAGTAGLLLMPSKYLSARIWTPPKFAPFA